MNLSGPTVAIKENGTLIGTTSCINFIGGTLTLVPDGAIDIDLTTLISPVGGGPFCIETATVTGSGVSSDLIKLRTGDIDVGEPRDNIGSIELRTGNNLGLAEGLGKIDLACETVTFFSRNILRQTFFQKFYTSGDGVTISEATNKGVGFLQRGGASFGIRTEITGSTAAGVTDSGHLVFDTGNATGIGHTSGKILLRTGSTADNGDLPGDIILECGQKPNFNRADIILLAKNISIFKDDVASSIDIQQFQEDVNKNAFDGSGFLKQGTDTFYINTITGDLELGTGIPPTDGFTPGNVTLITADASTGDTDSGNISFKTGAPIGTGVKGVIKHNQTISTEVVWEQGATGARPGAPVPGQRFFDTTLTKPIWFFGGSWLDATGGVV